MVTDQQVRRLMKLMTTETTLAAAAAKAGMSEPTARKYRRRRQLPSQTRKERVYRTRPDPFKEVWAEVEELLKRDSSIEAKTIFDYLCRAHEGHFQEAQLRTLQRRLKVWRARHGAPREVMFVQAHLPGRQAQSDFTFMNELGISIAGHILTTCCITSACRTRTGRPSRSALASPSRACRAGCRMRSGSWAQFRKNTALTLCRQPSITRRAWRSSPRVTRDCSPITA